MLPEEVRTPVTAYISAGFSFLFVFGGVCFVTIFGMGIFTGEGTFLPILFMALLPAGLLLGVVLGFLSGWQTIHQARLKAWKKAAAGKPKKTCAGCGEQVDFELSTCPMCGQTLGSS